MALLVVQRLKHLTATRETQVRSLSREAPLEKEMATHSSILAWRISPWREEPSRLQSTGSKRVGHYWATSLSLSRHYYFKYFFSFFLSFFSSGIPITCMFSFCNCLSFWIFCFIHFFFLFPVSFVSLYCDYLQAHWFFHSVMSSLLMNPSNSFSVTPFFISSIFFDLFFSLEFLSLCLHYPYVRVLYIYFIIIFIMSVS